MPKIMLVKVLPGFGVPVEDPMAYENLTERELPCVVLVKGEERYVFRYTPGNESALIACLMKYAQDETLSLTWVEALMVIRRVGI